MKKLRLAIDDLRVSSFDTASPPDGRGTVQGHDFTEATCEGIRCDTWHANTCQSTCRCSQGNTCLGGNTCQLSCYGTCHEQTACLSCTE